ncbi:uncharacterized protein LOC114942063 [Nylanderia fulva]|uniref:uncharacterized protein LOC114942063 n=1 Tax=Nylanderia fulva TaxID=613905 RepID=UPI0010FB8C05|nr:uncharacterized protein LOC114942063 [Nylanderia fulva]
MGRTRERSPNTASRQLDKQSYFFHGHKTEKDVDRKVVMFEDLGTKGVLMDYVRLADDTAAISGGSMNCFGGPDKEKSYVDYDDDKKHRCLATSSVRRLTHEMQRDSGNVEFLEKEGEIFKKSSNEFLQDTLTSKRRNFSFRNKDKTHKSLESLEKNIHIPAVDCKSLDLLPEEQSKTFFHGKQRSFDLPQKKSVDSTTNKTRKRLNFLQRVGRSLHFLPREREKRQDLSKREERTINNQYPQTDLEKCEYFLQRHQKNVDFFEGTPSALVNRAPVQSNLGSFDVVDSTVEQNSTSRLKDAQLKDTFHTKQNLNNSIMVDTENNIKQNNSDNANKSLVRSDISANIELTLTMQSRLPFESPIASVVTQDTVSGNKDSLDIGYSISELGRLYLHTLQNIDHADGLRPLENVADATEKRNRYIEWDIQMKKDYDILSHGMNSCDLAHNKPEGNLEILINILLDIFVWICI